MSTSSSAITIALPGPICPTKTDAAAIFPANSFNSYPPKCRNSPISKSADEYAALPRRSAHKRCKRKRLATCATLVPLLLWMILIVSPFLVTAVNANDDQYDNGNGYFDASDGTDVSGSNKYTEFYGSNGQKLTYDGISVMPVSCIHLNGGHLIKFQLFENESSYQCHLKVLGTYIVSVAHFMRAYFNYQALTKGRSFSLPSDAAYLNCVLVQSTRNSGEKLYAKIGCMDRDSMTSTKLALHLFMDKQCSMPFEDYGGLFAKNGYVINGDVFSNHVSFRPPFYSCVECLPQEISSTFQKYRYWYDDDYINVQGGKKQNIVMDDANDDLLMTDDAQQVNEANAANNSQLTDDLSNYFASYNDDTLATMNNLTATNNDYQANANQSNRQLILKPKIRRLSIDPTVSEAYHEMFWKDIAQMRRSLTDGSTSSWNMCQRIYKYGMSCGDDCKQLDTFHENEWSTSDIFLVVVMSIFMAAMMLLVFAKRVKAYEKASVYGDEVETNYPGLPPLAMLLIFVVLMAVIITMARHKLVNETLVFSVITCTLLFIYMLKLTLFENRPQLMASLTGRRGKKSHGFDMNRQLVGA